MPSTSVAAEADRIVRDHVVYSMAAGLVPIPWVDVAAVSAIQLDMLSKLAREHRVRFSPLDAKSLITALVGGGAARVGGQLLKFVPGVGSVLGGLTSSLASGASTYAVAQVALNEFAAGRELHGLDLDKAKDLYAEAFTRGQKEAEALRRETDGTGTGEIFDKLERLGRLRADGLLTEDEFEMQKQRLLERL
ncbi:MAG: DUF697 domain-containing protein [Acidobacteriota bacterium]